jgi:glutathione synthase/RimK-type ligase-like ATP-grasp enzyme
MRRGARRQTMKAAEPESLACRIVALGPSSGSRLTSFIRACTEYFGHSPAILSWQDFLSAPDRLETALGPKAFLRIDTPDRDIGSMAALYRLGMSSTAAAGYATLQGDDLAGLSDGAIGSPAQLSHGLVAGIEAAATIAERCGAIVSCTAKEVALAFDKTESLRVLRAAGIPTPRTLPGVAGWEALIAAMENVRMPRVFVKLRHGSAAAGMIAVARNGAQWIASTTAVLGGDGKLRATKRVRRVLDRTELAQLVDRLAPLGLHCEEWLPKIGIGDRTADLRLVMIGDAIVPVLRTSRHPMTNLHLDGGRASPARLIQRIGDAAWHEAIESARKAARCFPGLHTTGVDLAILADGRRHAVLEVNAFGDYIKDVAVDGLDSHQMQVRSIEARLRSGAACLPEAAA